MTRYRYNGVPLDSGGRYFYLREEARGRAEFWSPGWKPVRAELDSYECRHGLGYTRITGTRGGVRAEVLYFVPLGTNAEVHQVTLRNEGKARKKLRLFSLVEFCLWNAWDDQTNFQRNWSTGEVEASLVFATRPVTGSKAYQATGSIQLAFWNRMPWPGRATTCPTVDTGRMGTSPSALTWPP